MQRRDFLKTSAAFVVGPQSASTYRHRGYLGWITDLATQPDPFTAWPSLHVDDALLDDYKRSCALLRRLEFNEISLWGIYVAREWPSNVESSLSPERGAMVARIIDEAHRNGLRVYAGLGVYSWGFERIIREHPELSRGNPKAMCASEPAAWEWMRKVIDYVFTRLPVDGVSMQSADQGRCTCAQCRAYSDIEYHAILNIRTSQYIRHRYPGKTIGVNSWGMRFSDEASLVSLEKISRGVDYIIDAHDNSRAKNPAYRRQLIQQLACDFGTLGGPQVEPPQHWDRERWFLPTAKRQSEHIRDLAADGGRACEYFFHILANPGDEISLHAAGRALRQPQIDWRKHLADSIEEVFALHKTAQVDALAELFIDAEEAYFRHLPPGVSGTISMEPLESDKPGRPVYLTERLNPAQRKDYRESLTRLAGRFAKLAPDIPDVIRMGKIERSIGRVIADIDATLTGN
jgi:hypothetical protein